MITLAQAFGYPSHPRYAPSPQQPPQPLQPQPLPHRPVDQLGQMLGVPGNVSGSQEFCNMVLFIAFGIFSVFVLDSIAKLAAKKG